tara:strand:- start:334 stop:1023 length:690 start_codon:yes stop_codon:yes gene_type:complete
MNQHKFITRRSYSNEATLFINPGKNKLITKTKMPKMIYSLLIVLIIFTSLLSFSAFAIEPESPKQFWLIDKAKTAPIIFIATKGEIQKDDFLTFLLDSDNCEEIGLSFQITSKMESVPTNDDIFQVLVKHNPGYEYTTKAGIVETYDLGNSFYTQFMFANILSVQEVLEAFSQKESFEIELLYSDEGDLADPYLFFDIMTNKWGLSEFKKHLLEAQKKCRYQYFDTKEI